jgi:hypothetical protein
MDEKTIGLLKRGLKAQAKLIQLVKRINRLPDAQRKTLEAKNIIGPRDDKQLSTLIKDYEENKREIEGEIETKGKERGK